MTRPRSMVRTQSVRTPIRESWFVRAFRFLWAMTGPVFWLALVAIMAGLAGR